MAFAFFAFLLPRLLSGMQSWHLGLVGFATPLSFYSCSLVLPVLSLETLRLGVLRKKGFFLVFSIFLVFLTSRLLKELGLMPLVPHCSHTGLPCCANFNGSDETDWPHGSDANARWHVE